jgi:hypothetical protein
VLLVSLVVDSVAAVFVVPTAESSVFAGLTAAAASGPAVDLHLVLVVAAAAVVNVVEVVVSEPVAVATAGQLPAELAAQPSDQSCSLVLVGSELTFVAETVPLVAEAVQFVM